MTNANWRKAVLNLFSALVRSDACSKVHTTSVGHPKILLKSSLVQIRREIPARCVLECRRGRLPSPSVAMHRHKLWSDHRGFVWNSSPWSTVSLWPEVEKQVQSNGYAGSKQESWRSTKVSSAVAVSDALVSRDSCQEKIDSPLSKVPVHNTEK